MTLCLQIDTFCNKMQRNARKCFPALLQKKPNRRKNYANLCMLMQKSGYAYG